MPPLPKYEPESDKDEREIDASGAPVKLNVLPASTMLLEYASRAEAPDIAKLLMKLHNCIDRLAPCKRMEAAPVDEERPAKVDAIIVLGVGFDLPPLITMPAPEKADAWRNFVLETDIEFD